MSRPETIGRSPERFRWIVDGHNVLFGVRRWARLQAAGEGRTARDQIEAWLEPFGRAIGAQIWLVFDGAPGQSGRESFERPHLKVVYSDPPEEADDRIRRLADRSIRAGEIPCVVSSDEKTLIRTLPGGSRSLSVPQFRRLLERVLRGPEKWVRTEDLADVEAHFLRASPFESDREEADRIAPPGGGEEDGEPPPVDGSGAGPGSTTEGHERD